MSRIEIQADKLGGLEAGWWKAHNDKDKPKMAELLLQQNIVFYGFSLEEAKEALSKLVAGIGYHDVREWDKAIDSVTEYYQMVKESTGLDFDAREVAGLEVGWWELHDKLEHNPDKTELALAFAKLYSKLFGVNEQSMMKAGQIRAEATREHDLAEQPNTPILEVEEHWNNVERLLVDFYTEVRNSLTT